VCAELGVASGGFSQVILDIVKPSKLHLIDSWDATWNNGPERYQRVTKNLGVLPNVEIHRGLTDDVVDQFEDRYFDWIYIDACHKYNGILSDLINYRPKIKDNCFVLGHDFTCLTTKNSDTTDVLCAVLDVIQDGLYHMVAMSEETTIDPEDGGIALKYTPSFALKKTEKGG